MTQFHDMKVAISKQFDMMAASSQNLFVSNASKDELWDTYLSSFTDELNPLYRERSTHDCNCCKQFIRKVGNVVAIIDNKLVSIWDVQIDGEYQLVADAMSNLVKNAGINSVFQHNEAKVGTDFNFEEIEGKPHKWEHFYQVLPRYAVVTDGSIGKNKGNSMSNRAVLERSVTEITDDSIDTVLDLIKEGQLYRGEEHKHTVISLQSAKRNYQKADDKNLFLWTESMRLGRASAFRNTVIGTLLDDISNDVDLTVAVKKFEDKVAPYNYKRPTAVVSKKMVEEAQKKVQALGIEDALPRRYAVMEDLTINNVLFADRSAKQSMGVVMDLLAESVKPAKIDEKNAKEISAEDFINTVMPKSTSIELLVSNNHVNNFVSLVAPVNQEAKNILKWNNNFTWTYNGEVTDSIKDRVKKAGGNVTGDVRASLSWYNLDDLDIHVLEPGGTEIYHSRPTSGATGGKLDVDMNVSNPVRDAVENVVWPSYSKMKEGTYTVLVNNFTKRESVDVGFEVEFEYKGQVHNYVYDKAVRKVEVLKFNYSKKNGITIVSSIPESTASKEIWGVNTNSWTKVSTIMNSPNHWDGEKTGNKHLFFMLDGCANPDTARGFYNEFLSSDLEEHRKVFELLGAKLRVPASTSQLSGLGFSSTQRNEVLVKVQGEINRVLKVKF